MPGEFDHKIWSVTDFKRYHNGTMPDAERHALEKASLEDPFLLDALDGYSKISHPQEDLAAIKERLWPSKKEQAPVVWYKRGKLDMLWKAAAVFIIVGGLGWLIYSSNQENNMDAAKDNFAAVEKTIPSQLPADSNARISTDAAIEEEGAPGSSSTPTVTEPVTNAQSAPPVSQLPVEDESIVRIDRDRTDSSVMVAKPATQDAVAGKVAGVKVQAAGNEQSKELARDVNRVTGRVVDQAGQPVPYAAVVLSNNQGVAADANGNFSLRNNNAPTEKVSLRANAAGYETTNAVVANNSSENNIVLKQSDEQLAEVVVTSAFNTKRTARSVASNVQTRSKSQWNADSSNVILKNATPVNGWDHFYSFMNDSTGLKSFATAKKGKVIIAFAVDPAGKISEFKIKQKLTPQADSLSQKILLQSPPLMLIKASKKAEMTIRFR